jgi:hypothetical protein
MRERVADIHVPRRARVLIGLVVMVAAIVALVVTGPLAGRNETARNGRAQHLEIGTARLAAAYGQPPRCSAGAIARHDVTAASPVFDRAVWCLRYGYHAAVSFYRFIGAP